jgi:hypothetical protein
VKSDFGDVVMGYVYPIGLLGMCGAPAIWCFQIYYWLRVGEWLPISVADGLRAVGLFEPKFDWIGVQKLSDFLLSAPLSLAFLFVPLGIMLAFQTWMEAYTKKAPASALGHADDNLAS